MRVALLPVLLPVVVVPGMVGVAFFLVVMVPPGLARAWVLDRRFWRKLRDRGQVGRWDAVPDQLAAGTGTLVVEVGPKGPACCWYIDRPREAVDPGRVVPNWREFADRGWDVVDLPLPAAEEVNRWTTERLGKFESSVLAVLPTWEQLDALPDDVKQGAVLVVLGWWEGRLSRRLG